MAVISAHIPVVEAGGGSFTRVDIVCGLRIISASVDRTNLKYGSEPIGQGYSMPWAYPDGDLGDLGGPTTIILSMLALLPQGRSTPLHLSATLNAAGANAIEDIETALHAMVADAALEVDTSGLTSTRVRIISLTGDESFDPGPIVVQLMGRSAAELATGLPDAFIGDVVLAQGLAGLDYTADTPRPRTVNLVSQPLAAEASPWLRLRGITKLADLGVGQTIGLDETALPTLMAVPWHVNTTKPAGNPEDGPVSSHVGVSRFDEIVTAGDLNLDDSDIPTGWILVHDLHYTFHDGFLELEADLSWTTPTAPTFKLAAFGALRGEVRLQPVSFEDNPFDPGTLNNPFEVEVELEWDDDPGSDLEDWGPVDPAFEAIVSGVIRDVVQTEISSQIENQVAPRVLGIIRGELDQRRPEFFTDDGWLEFREQIVDKFFIRFLRAEFFGRRTVRGVTVVGGLELPALAGSFSDNLSVLDLGDQCPAVEVGAGFAGFTAFQALSRFRSAVRSEPRCSGWHDRYAEHRKELFALVTRQPKRAARIVKTAFAVSPILASPRARLDPGAVKDTVAVIDEISKKVSAPLAKDLALFRDLVTKGEGATLEGLVEMASESIPPSTAASSEMHESDAPRILKARKAKEKRSR